MPSTELRSTQPSDKKSHPPFLLPLEKLRTWNTRRRKERIFGNTYEVQAFEGDPEVWERFGDTMLTIQRTIYDPIFREYHEQTALVSQKHASDAERLETEVTHQDTIVVALIDKQTKNLVGFTYAAPSHLYPDWDEKIKEREMIGATKEEYQALLNRTADIGFTNIAEEHRSRGGWSHMMDLLEKKLLQTSRYDEMIRVVRLANDYGDKKVRSRYTGRIVREFPVDGMDYGPQLFFRIRLRS